MRELPAYLREAPEPSSELPPPTRPRAGDLPLRAMPWPEFEKLALRLFALEHDLVDHRVYGNPGQDQEGIDLYGTSASGRHTAQCRRVRVLGPVDIRTMVSDFLEGRWADTSQSLTLFTTASTRETGIANEIERQREVLADRGVTFIVRDGERLQEDLRTQPALVDAFFGEDWRRAFCAYEDASTTEVAAASGMREMAELAIAAARRPRVVDIGSLNAAVQRAIRVVTDNDEAEFPLLDPLLADPHPAERAAAWIAQPPEPVAEASWQLWAAITRIAERGGQWTAAADGWLRIAGMRDGDGELRAVVNASIAAGIAGDDERADELLERGRALNPEHPKVRLQEIGKLEEPGDQLAALDGLESDDEDEQALIELNRALAYVQMNAFEETERCLARAEQAAADRLTQLPVIRANLTVQRNRMNASRGRPIDGRALDDAQRACLDARETLISEHRFGESVRALMLAVDTVAMRTDFAGAEALLQLATEEEIAARDGSGVLGDAALRCLLPRLALRFTERAQETPERRRIRAAANVRLRHDTERNRAELRQIALGDTNEALMAALEYCRDAAFHGGPWDADVARILARENPIEAVTLETWHLVRSARYEDAPPLLSPYEGEHWALQLRFTLADVANHPDALELVPRVLASNPDRHQRLRCAAVLLGDGQSERAEDAARQVAEDESASVAERCDGYDQLLRVLAADERWEDAQRDAGAWTRVDPTDERLNGWLVRVGNRLRSRT